MITSLKTIIAGAVLVIFGILSANASDWVFSSDASAFNSEPAPAQILVVEGEFGLGVRCNEKGYHALFLIGVTGSQSFIKTMNELSPEIWLRVDDSEVLKTPGIAYDYDGKTVILADVSVEFVDQIGAAKNQISVMYRFADSDKDEATFSVAGSTAAAKKVQDVCKFLVK